jgi:hypothetical protein
LKRPSRPLVAKMECPEPTVRPSSEDMATTTTRLREV